MAPPDVHTTVRLALLVAGVTAGARAAEARILSFEERVAAQASIERIYDRQRLWPGDPPKLPFERRVPRLALEKKVREGLRKGAALEEYWHRSVTAGQIQAEMDRMGRDSNDSALLRELFEALDDDPTVIGECLVRPILTDRLLQHWYAYDRRFHEETWAAAERARRDLTLENFDAYSEGVPTRALYALEHGNLDAGPDAIAPAGEPRLIVVDPRALDRLRVLLRGGGAVLREQDGSLDVLLLAHDEGEELHVLRRRFDKQPFGVWWMSASRGLAARLPEVAAGLKLPPMAPHRAPPPWSCDYWASSSLNTEPRSRRGHTAVWTGAEMVVWGGGEDRALNTGLRYDPASDTWAPTSAGPGVPSPRGGHTAVWTGREMIVWGGTISDASGALDTGGRYDPLTDTWRSVPRSGNAPSARFLHAAVWTGREMIVWGGAGNGLLDTGGRYDPVTDTWTPTSTGPATPAPRYEHTAVWTGAAMIVWGGLGAGPYPSGDGARYDPVADTWRPTSTGGPSARFGHSAVWTGTE